MNKKKLAGLLEMWLLERGHEFAGVGSWTLKKERKKALPDLVIEVDWSRSSSSKRAIYERLGVRELWTLRPDGTCVIHVLTRGKYVERSESKLLPDLNVKWLLGFLPIEPQSRSVRALRDALRRRPRRRR